MILEISSWACDFKSLENAKLVATLNPGIPLLVAPTAVNEIEYGPSMMLSSTWKMPRKYISEAVKTPRSIFKGSVTLTLLTVHSLCWVYEHCRSENKQGEEAKYLPDDVPINLWLNSRKIFGIVKTVRQSSSPPKKVKKSPLKEYERKSFKSLKGTLSKLSVIEELRDNNLSCSAKCKQTNEELRN